MSKPTSTPPYTILAAGYDFVMSHVDYHFWADYIYDILQRHQSDARSVLELGCGTGSLAMVLQPQGGYRYLATDISDAMLNVARQKAAEENADVRFDLADFTDFNVDQPVDVILLLYDGLNYLLEKGDIRLLLNCVFDALAPGGVFVVDQSTPSNSINNEPYFEHSDSVGPFSYVRRSLYDSESRLHRTTLELRVDDEEFCEEHLQRAYETGEIEGLVLEAGFAIEAAYDSFSTEPINADTERIHWVLRRPPNDDA